MTIIGPDRTGLVESVARVVADHGGNWLESRMCRLGGEFAGILRIELPVEKRQALLDALQTLQGRGLHRRRPPRRGGGRPGARPADQIRNRRARPSGHRPRNHPRAGAAPGVNVEEFSSECRQRSHVRRNAVQGQCPVAIARRLQPRRAENGIGKNRRRFAGGRFVCRTRRPVGIPVRQERAPTRPTQGFETGRLRRPGHGPRVLSPPVALVVPFFSHLVSGDRHFLLRHRPLGLRLCLAYALHPSASVHAQAGTRGCSPR